MGISAKWKRSCTVLFCLWLGLTAGATAADTAPETPAAASAAIARDRDRLADSANPYLLSHARNPVDWYLRSRLMAPDGCFYTAEDASVGAQKDTCYLWSNEEIDSALGARDAVRMLAHVQLMPLHQPFTESALQERGVLRLRLPAAASAVGTAFDTAAADAPLLARLLAVRQARPQPARDEKLVVALNGLAIDALACSSAILREPRLLDMARRAGERIGALAYDDMTKELKHQVYRGQAKGAAFLGDYALLGRAYLALRDAGGDKIWFQRAAWLGDDILKSFALPDGSLRTAPAEQDLLIDPRHTAETVIRLDCRRR